MRNTRWAAAAAAVAIAVLAGCSGGEGALHESAESTPATAQETEAAPMPDESTTTTESAHEPTTPETTTAEAGTRDNPGMPGRDTATFSTGEEKAEISLGEATWDADEIVAAENRFNDPPEDGMVYVLVPVTATYTGPDTMTPWLDISVVFLADNGRSYESVSEVIPDSLRDIADVYDGGTATGNVLFALPIDQVTGGMWGVSYGWSDPLWWEAI